MKARHFGAMFALALGASCAPGLDEPDEHAAGPLPDASGLEPQGTSLNGTSLNGTSMNGTSLNGAGITGLTLFGLVLGSASIGGVTLSGVKLTATNFSGTKSGVAVSGAGFVGAVFNGELSNGTTLKVRVDSRTALAAPNADVYAYGVSYQTSSGWSPLCGLDAAGAPVLAVPTSGTWDQRQGVTGGGNYAPDATRFTFGCRGFGVAKCIELGYKPWKTVGGVNLQNHLNACVRMLRADYCGDGKSWTKTGTQVNVYDNLGVQGDTQAWSFEAEWTPNGARFLGSGTRKRYELLGSTVPSCVPTKTSTSAGSAANWSTGTLLMNEY